MAEWSQLPNDLIEMIAVRLEAVEDFLAFSAVCHSWRSFYLIKKWAPAGFQVPWLMLSDDENGSKRGFFSLHRDKVYQLELAEASGRRCWGSSDGWLVTIGSDLEVHLLNAFTKVRIGLPSANTFQILFNSVIEWYQFIDKAVVVVDGEELLVLAIYGPFHQLAFAKPDYSSWISVEDSSSHRFMDVACVNDQIFALSALGKLFLVKIGSQLQEIVLANTPPRQLGFCEGRYLAESAGDLLLVYQYLYIGLTNHPPVEPIQFEVFKFDFVDKKWIKVRDLGDQALFVGDNVCVSVKASRCRSNSIYFVGSKVENWWRFDEHFVDRDSGVYNMAEGTVEPFYFGADYPSYYSCPIWLTPKLVYAQED